MKLEILLRRRRYACDFYAKSVGWYRGAVQWVLEESLFEGTETQCYSSKRVCVVSVSSKTFIVLADSI